MRVLFCIDPGTRNTGWAKIKETPKGWKIVNSGLIQIPKVLSSFEKIYSIRERCRKLLLKSPRATEVWIEGYTSFGAMKQSKEQYVLQGALYSLYDNLKQRKESAVRVVPPSVWKPWIDKQNRTNLQILNSVSRAKKSQHELDAIGVGEFAIAFGLEYVGETRRK